MVCLPFQYTQKVETGYLEKAGQLESHTEELWVQLRDLASINKMEPGGGGAGL